MEPALEPIRRISPSRRKKNVKTEFGFREQQNSKEALIHLGEHVGTGFIDPRTHVSQEQHERAK